MVDQIEGILTVYMFIFKNNKKYVGITTRPPEKRKSEHISCSGKPNPTFLVHKAIKLYGNDSFEMVILATTTCKDDLCSLEQKYIQEYNTYFENGMGYNMTLGGEGNFGYKFTDEVKLKMSQSKKTFLQNNPQHIEHHKAVMKKYWTDENKLAMSILKKEQLRNNPEIIEKQRKSRGEWTDEQRAKCSLIVKEQFKKNPERAKQISIRTKIRGNTLEGKKRGNPKPFNVHLLNGEFIGTYDYVPFAVNDILNERRLLNDITEKTLGSNIRRVLTGTRTHTKGLTFKYV